MSSGKTIVISNAKKQNTLVHIKAQEETIVKSFGDRFGTAGAKIISMQPVLNVFKQFREFYGDDVQGLEGAYAGILKIDPTPYFEVLAGSFIERKVGSGPSERCTVELPDHIVKAMASELVLAAGKMISNADSKMQKDYYQAIVNYVSKPRFGFIPFSETKANGIDEAILQFTNPEFVKHYVGGNIKQEAFEDLLTAFAHAASKDRKAAKELRRD